MTDVSDTTPDLRTDGDKRRGPRGLYGPDRDAEWLDRHRAGWLAGESITQIAAGLNCSRNTVVRLAKKLELPERPEGSHHPVKPDEWVATLRSKWATGKSASKIAADMGCHTSMILRSVKRYDLPARPPAILRNVTPKPRDTYRHRPGYIKPGRVTPVVRPVIEKAPAQSFPSAPAPTPTLSGPPNEPRQVRVGVPTHPCQHVITEDPERKTCGFACYTPPKHDKPSAFCTFHHHFGGRL